MSIVKMADLNARFTAIAAEYMARGLQFDCNAMKGSQGEIGKVALADNKYVYLIYMKTDNIIVEREYKGKSKWRDYTDGLRIVVEKHERDLSDLVSDFHTYWLGAGEVVYEEAYYEIGYSRRSGKVYTNSEDEYVSAAEKKHARYDWSNNWEAMKYNQNTIISVIKAKTGRKRVFAENIVKVEKRTDSNCWQIVYTFAGRQDNLYVKATA